MNFSYYEVYNLTKTKMSESGSNLELGLKLGTGLTAAVLAIGVPFGIKSCQEDQEKRQAEKEAATIRDLQVKIKGKMYISGGESFDLVDAYIATNPAASISPMGAALDSSTPDDELTFLVSRRDDGEDLRIKIDTAHIANQVIDSLEASIDLRDRVTIVEGLKTEDGSILVKPENFVEATD